MAANLRIYYDRDIMKSRKNDQLNKKHMKFAPNMCNTITASMKQTPCRSRPNTMRTVCGGVNWKTEVAILRGWVKKIVERTLKLSCVC